MEKIGRRFWIGFGWGLLGTLAMSVLMYLMSASGVSPMPKPIPLAIMGTLFGPETSKPALVILALAAHFGYGAIWAGILAHSTRPVTLAKGLGLGIFLWVLMQILVLPFIGWGVFGLLVSPLIWVATLVLHLVYGGAVGLLVDRKPWVAYWPYRRPADHAHSRT